MKYFVVSDIHGYFDIFIRAIKDKDFDESNPEHILIVLGDIFDRGPQNVQVYNYLKSLSEQNKLIFIRGNHEDLLFDCFKDIINNRQIFDYHFSNGTINTIHQFTDLPEWIFKTKRIKEFNDLVYEKIYPILEWIDETSLDYKKLGNYIFVHGWVPCDSDDKNKYHAHKKMILTPIDTWNKNKWDTARWLNGMEAWKQGCIIPNKTIVCGHWNCSWGWSHIRQQCKEFPNKNRKDWQLSFEPFIDNGIIALDACTAYSGLMNCLVLDI